MTLPYGKVLIVGATSGIGEAYAERVIADGKQVVITGRRHEKLDAFVNKHGKDRADSFAFDITKLKDIPGFVDQVTNKHPDISLVLLNSGIQRPFNFANPETVDLSTLEEELTTNYTAYVHLTKALLPFLQAQPGQTGLAFTSSGLALVPLYSRPNYSASKAALHHFILALREQLKSGPGNIKVIEIYPPAVQTELHDEKHQQHRPEERKRDMPLSAFTDESWAKLVRGDEQIPIGYAEQAYNKFETLRQESFQQMMQGLKAAGL